ncbi:hypothetical protein FS749_008257 [Ceratobasidium sp. UAMH 11750]|nr:hypothetical protein FS749_008257 [Ceratobasidium sp. UAMH 11750]
MKGDGVDQHFEPTLVWQGVGSGSSITAQFTPIVQAYVTDEYQTSQLLRGDIVSDLIWQMNLSELHEVTDWKFEEDDSNGAFSIIPI